ncbi:uncharacterized protein C2845_PM03G02250 [Panicum miliaceum]|uniref:Cathepsin propeptide inhibitor domain-containing protein n=1 Tax=Panicum miliaceum TaxID=4540 RepID=A0A3L6TC26_PANMI|nr:uncharacterized protein C2845_PM03G02250 [Panicum miliaceum]
MSLRALSSLLIRRFSPRRIPAAQAETIGSASGRPARSLHTLSNPDAAVRALGALSVAGLAALVGFLYLKKDDKDGEVTHEGASNVVVTDMGAALNDPAIMAMFTDKDGNIACMEYNDYLLFRMHYLNRTKIPVTDREARSEVPDSRKVSVKQVGNVMKVDEAAMKKRFEELTKKHDEAYENYWKMVIEREYKVDEAVMKKRFEDWMEEYGRTYKDEEEKARRYEAFKVNAMKADKLNAHSRGDARYGPSNHGDWTEDEFKRMDCRQGDMDWKSYVEDMRAKYAEGRFDAHRRKVAPQELDCTDAVKKRFRGLAARKAEQERQANKH